MRYYSFLTWEVAEEGDVVAGLFSSEYQYYFYGLYWYAIREVYIDD